MRNPLSQKITNMPPSGIRKFFDVAATMEDVVSLGVGEPDFDTPLKVREAGIESLRKGQTTYTSNSGLQELRDEIAAYMQRSIGMSYDSGTEVLVTVGGSEGIDATLRCLLNPGDEVLLPEPTFVSYRPCTIMSDGVPITIPLKNENQFRLTAAELEAAITPKSKVLILSFPNNPTGAIMTKEDLVPIAELAIKHDLIVISDEIYAELTYQGEHVSIASLPGMRERTVIINGFSKAFAMTGWRLGWVCGPELIVEQILKLHQYALMCAPTTSQYAAIVALRDCSDEVAEMRESYNERRKFLLKEFDRLGMECFEAMGAFYLFPSIQRFGLSSDEFATRIIQEERLAVVPGTAFGDSGEGFLRISYAYSIEDLKEAIVRLERFIKKLEA
ncbi:MAG: aminotransferase class I/II-fold pyridoxal phosphate-dependent enzyme [Coriobacteriia bacterium]|nr:aminotransferase class I/II-fold pyridoxal phosphate-dependent enzyme [Coriobacteriia bacterium]MCL2870550.1 aminotransferase class I/II-fold pyridoxal phosphate-dependent enzyme [Coriobacteriia bacterium]